MEFYKILENKISWEKSMSEQTKALAYFDNISDNEIKELLKCVKWSEAGILIEYLGHEKLKDYLPQILEILEDMNWPASGGASNMLRKSEDKIIPEIKRVFHEVQNDSIWHYWILVGIIRNWNKNLITELKPDLENLVMRADKEGAAIEALKILQEEKLVNNSEILKLYKYLKKEYESDDYWLKELKIEIKAGC